MSNHTRIDRLRIISDRINDQTPSIRKRNNVSKFMRLITFAYDRSCTDLLIKILLKKLSNQLLEIAIPSNFVVVVKPMSDVTRSIGYR